MSMDRLPHFTTGKRGSARANRSYFICLPLIAGLLLLRSCSFVSYDAVDGRQLAPHPFPITRIDINTCDATELLLLPDVGPQLANRIIEQRETHGLFSELQDLAQVPGLGPKTLLRLEPYLDF